MVVILLTRLGQTDLNIKNIFRGRTNVELNETGIKQAKLLAEYFQDAGISLMYSCPLKRAVKTAKIGSVHNSFILKRKAIINNSG